MDVRPCWRLIRSGAMTGAENMALDEALLEAVAGGSSPPVLRFYRWRPAAVTLGYAQRGRHRVDHAVCRSLGVDVVRRITGGRAVLHDCEITYSVISPESRPPFPGGVLNNYRVIAEVLKRTVSSFGIEAELAPRSDPGARGAMNESGRNCFAVPSPCELVYRGCKLTGNAQKRFRGAFLQHGSIPLELDLERLFRVMHGGGSEEAGEGRRILAARVGWLNRWMKQPVTLDELEGRLLGNFIDEWGLQIEEGRPTDDELSRMRALATGKYADPDWNRQPVARHDAGGVANRVGSDVV